MDIKRASQVNLSLGFLGLGILIFDFLKIGRLSWNSIIIFLIIFMITIIIEKKYFNDPTAISK